jgi:hypothetical protein
LRPVVTIPFCSLVEEVCSLLRSHLSSCGPLGWSLSRRTTSSSLDYVLPDVYPVDLSFLTRVFPCRDGRGESNVFLFWPIRFIWTRIKPLLERLEHFDFLWGKLGGAVLLAKALPIIAATIIVIVAASEDAPLYVLMLAALAAAALVLMIVWLFQIVSKNASAQLTTESHSGNNSTKVRVPLGAYLLTSTLVVAGVLYYIHNWPSLLDYNSTRLNFSLDARPITVDNKYLGYDVRWRDTGPLNIRNVRYFHHFKSSSEALTHEEIDSQLDDVERKVPPRGINVEELSPQSAADWITMDDHRFSANDWDDVKHGKIMIYFFSVFKYDVEERAKTVKICFIFGSDFPPAVHTCLHNNETSYDK